MQSEQGRNKGMRRHSGQIIKGTLKEAGLKMKASSIPTKIQNVIYNNHHSPAFGNSQERFHVFTNSKLEATPGPGNYNLNIVQAKIDSKKGTGYLASQTTLSRFNNMRNSNPGPGRYQVPKRLLSNAVTPASMNTKEQARQLFKSQIQNAIQKPSPCAYEGRIFKSASAATNIFKSKNQRFRSKKEDFPGVGAYEWQLIRNKVKSLKFSKEKEGAQTVRSFRQNYVDQLMKIKIDPKSQLGPGKYDTKLSATTKTFTFSKEKLNTAKANQFFKEKINQQMEIGLVTKQKDQDAPRLKQLKGGHASIFKSKTRRYQFGQSESRIFGDPRKYSPIVQKRNSHLLNFGNKWV